MRTKTGIRTGIMVGIVAASVVAIAGLSMAVEPPAFEHVHALALTADGQTLFLGAHAPTPSSWRRLCLWHAVGMPDDTGAGGRRHSVRSG